MTNVPKRAAWSGAVAAVTLCLACPSLEPVDHCCSGDAECDDGVFCDGAETCDGCLCRAGTPPCGGPLPSCSSCDEEADVCIVPECILHADCDDRLFCNGAESCSGACVCTAGTPPCEQDFVCVEEFERCVDPAICAWCDEDTGLCVDGCVADTDCDDHLFCNGVESCDECSCHVGSPPCENDCDEEQDECFTPCADHSDCVDGNLCTSDFCWNGVCSKRTRECSFDHPDYACFDDAECNPATGLCELPDGSDPCLSYCEIWGCECVEPDIDQMEGFDARLDSRSAEMEGIDPEWGFFLVAGTCQDGTLFIFGDGWHNLAEYFEPQTGAFIGRIFASDALEPVCCGITYWPRLIECEDAVVTDVFVGVTFEVGDSITLPEPWPGPC